MRHVGALLVAHGFDAPAAERWKRFLGRADLGDAVSLVVDNAGGAHADLTGSNDQFEFSGYLEGLRSLRSRSGPLDRIVIFNDTLFAHHWSTGWAHLVANASNEGGVWGDPRVERAWTDGRELRFLASWHFDVRGRDALDLFEDQLKATIQGFTVVGADAEYEAHLDRYLESSLTSGYSKPSGIVCDEDRLRKLRCIRAEHQLSRLVFDGDALRSYSGIRYQGVHTIDRLLSASRRVRSLRERRSNSNG